MYDNFGIMIDFKTIFKRKIRSVVDKTTLVTGIPGIMHLTTNYCEKEMDYFYQRHCFIDNYSIDIACYT